MAESSGETVGEEKNKEGDSSGEVVAEAKFLSQKDSRIMHMMKCSMGLYGPLDKPKPIVSEFTLKGVAEYIQTKNCRKIIVMAGAGISTAAGIPDYRSPGTGLYHNLKKYNIPNPESINNIEYFKKDPRPYFERAKAMLEKDIKPTLTHYFIKSLEDEGRLLRVFTQNIDGLDHAAGVSEDKLVEAHGSNRQGHCMLCNELYPQEKLRDKIFASPVPKCDTCEGVVKPDVVLFGESLPPRFGERVKEDFPVCDCLLILGTSLSVQPFASLTGEVEGDVLRVLINREKSTGNNPLFAIMGLKTGLDFDSEHNFRDVFYEGSCDDGCLELADHLGFKERVQDLYKAAHCDSQESALKEGSSMVRPSVATEQDSRLPSTSKGRSTRHVTESSTSSPSSKGVKTAKSTAGKSVSAKARLETKGKVVPKPSK